MKELCKRVSRKIHALARIRPYIDFPKKGTLFNAFFKSQFSYCPLAQMCHSHMLNSKINALHEKHLQIIYNHKQSTFKELLDKEKFVSIHNQNL